MAINNQSLVMAYQAFLAAQAIIPPPPALQMPPGKTIYFSNGWRDGLSGWTIANSPENIPNSGLSSYAAIHNVYVGTQNIVRFALSGRPGVEQPGARLGFGDVGRWGDLAPYLNRLVSIDWTIFPPALPTLQPGGDQFLEYGVQIKTNPNAGATIATMLQQTAKGTQFWLRSAVTPVVQASDFPLLQSGTWQQQRLTAFLSPDPAKGYGELLFQNRKLRGYGPTMNADGSMGLFPVLYGNNFPSTIEMYLGDFGITLLDG